MAEYKRLEILKSIKETLKPIVPIIYYTDRPSSTTSQQDCFLVIRNGEMDDLGAYGETYVSLVIFYRDKDGLERTDKLDQLQKSILKVMPMNNDLFYSERPQLLSSKSDGSGYHYLTIYFGITIK